MCGGAGTDSSGVADGTAGTLAPRRPEERHGFVAAVIGEFTDT
jgi:hypothetical protein